MSPFIKLDGYLNQKKNDIWFSKMILFLLIDQKSFNSSSQSSHKKGLIYTEGLIKDRMGVTFVTKGELTGGQLARRLVHESCL